MHNMKRINFYLTDKQTGRLRLLSQETGLSVSELVRRAIDIYLRKESPLEEDYRDQTLRD